MGIDGNGVMQRLVIAEMRWEGKLVQPEGMESNLPQKQ